MSSSEETTGIVNKRAEGRKKGVETSRKRDLDEAKEVEGVLDEVESQILKAVLGTTEIDPREPITQQNIYGRLARTCDAAGMKDGGQLEHRFFQTIADPAFNRIVKLVGQGLIGGEIVPIVQKMIAMAKDGDKACMKWALEIFGILESKFDFYLKRRAMDEAARPQVNIANVIMQDKTNDELEEIARSL